MTLPTVCRRCDGPCQCDPGLLENEARRWWNDDEPSTAPVVTEAPAYDWAEGFKAQWNLSDEEVAIAQSMTWGHQLTWRFDGREYQGLVDSKPCGHVHRSASEALVCAAAIRETLPRRVQVHGPHLPLEVRRRMEIKFRKWTSSDPFANWAPHLVDWAEEEEWGEPPPERVQ